MKNEADRLLQGLDDIRSNAGTAGPDHPKVKKWVGEVRSHLAHVGSAGDLKRFEQLEIVKGGSEMWSRETLNPAGIRKFKADLDVVETILREMSARLDPSPQTSADQRIRELFLTSPGEGPEEGNIAQGRRGQTEPFRSLEQAMDNKIEPNFDAVTKQHLSPSAREKTIDQLMGDLNDELKRSEPNWERIQEVMGALIGLKKTGELLDKLKGEINNRGVKWETIRGIMAQLWSIKKEIVIDLLPILLKT